MKILDPGGIRLWLHRTAAMLEDLRCPFEQRFLSLMDHRWVNTKPARQLGNRLLALQGFKGNACFEIRLVLLALPHR